MFNQKLFNQVCSSNDIESVFVGETLVLVCSKLPSKDVQDQIKNLLPKDVRYEFKVSVKASTIAGVKTYLGMGGCPVAKFDVKDGHMDITLPVSKEINYDSPVWEQIHAVLKTDNYLQTWRIVTPNEVVRSYNRKIAEEPRPLRDKPITNDDLLNLKIDLEGDVLDVIRRL